MRNKEAALNFSCWCENLHEDKQRARGEAIMRRVGGRMRNMEAAMHFGGWLENWHAEKKKALAEGIMRRVGGRMRNKEVLLARISNLMLLIHLTLT